MSPAKRDTPVTAPRGKPFRIHQPPLYEVRSSPIHGTGVFAARRIRKGTRILEYLGDRISHATADKRYESHDDSDNHTFLFIVDKHTVLDAEIGGNDARWINHCCDGNCDSLIQWGRVFIEARRTIEPGEELGYDYEIGREKDDPDNVDEVYACRCGSPKCRGTMLWPAKREDMKKKKKKKKQAVRAKATPKTRSKSATPAKKKKRGRRRP